MITEKTNQTYKNAMELLVAEEISKQIQRLPEHLSKYINRVEVATYALNRLPPLYASCEEGLARQKVRGRNEFQKQITESVKQSFAAVQRDLLRTSKPLIADSEDSDIIDARNALQELADFLPHREFSWHHLVKLIKPLLVQLANRELTPEEMDRLSSQLSYSWNDPRYMR
jgi:Late competence development protein ComFB